MGCFGVMAVALFGFGVSLAIERGQGWLQVKRASPMPVSAYSSPSCSAAVVFSTVIMVLLLAVGIMFGGVHLPLATAAKLVGILVAGSIPFSAMGLAIGYFAKPNSAPAVVNLIYLPMSFCSGLWIPLFMLPHGLQMFAQSSAALSPEPARAEPVGTGHESDSGVGTCRSADCIHVGLAWDLPHGAIGGMKGRRMGEEGGS